MSVELFRPDPTFTPSAAFEKQQSLLNKVASVFAFIICAYTVLIFTLMPGFTPGKAVAVSACATLSLIAWLSRYKRFYHVCAIGIIVVTLAAGFGASLTNGGLEGYVAPILITTPIAAALFLGARATLYAAAASIAVYCLLSYMHAQGVVSSTSYSVQVTSIAALVMLTTATLICAAGLGYFARESQNQIRSLVRAQKELVSVAEKLRHSASHDPLTGIANRAMLSAHLAEIAASTRNLDRTVCLVHLDLDRFKAINDTHGHPVGDGVLRKVANIMTRTCADDDLVARIGGDEFVIVKTLKPFETADDIHSLSRTLIDTICQPMLVEGIECSVGVSVGFVLSDADCFSPDSLMKNADLALYDAKNAGKGIARQFSSAMRDKLELKRSLLEDLESAFEEDRIYCALQPQICLETGAVRGLEALGRVRSRTGKPLQTSEFLTILEDAHLVHLFDEHVMRDAFRSLSKLRQAGYHIPTISLNASAGSLRREGFVDFIQSELRAFDLSEHDVVVEILESLLIEDLNDQAAATIAELKRCGILTVLDDFGSGHASMASLLQLQVDGVKVDQSLIKNIEEKRAQQMVSAILSLSKSLDLPAVIEGIETPQQYSILKRLGGEIGQGFGICKPVSCDDLMAWLEAHGRSEIVRIQDRLSSIVSVT